MSKSNQPVQPRRKMPTRDAIRRSVASSTAIDTGWSVAEAERKLRSSSKRYRHIKLAQP